MPRTKRPYDFACLVCPYVSYYKSMVLAHVEQKHKHLSKAKKQVEQKYRHKCIECNLREKSVREILLHHKKKHRDLIDCAFCVKRVESQIEYLSHLERAHFKPCKTNNFCTHENIFDRVIIRRLSFMPEEETSIEYTYYVRYRNIIKSEFEKMLKKYRFFKVMLVSHVLFQKIGMEGEVLDTCTIPITSGCMFDFRMFDRYNFKQMLSEMIQTKMENLEKVETKGSGLVMKYISDIDIRFCIPSLIGGCNETKKLQKLKNFSSVKPLLLDVSDPKKNDCFLQAVSLGKVLSQNPSLKSAEKQAQALVVREYINKHFSTKILKRFSFPFHIKNCRRFEKAFSKLDIAINVWTISHNSVYTLYQSDMKECISRLDLFLAQPTVNNPVGHYMLIDNTATFLKTVKQHCLNKSRTQRVGRDWLYCNKCAQIFTSEKLLKSHTIRCTNPNGQIIKYAQKGEQMMFNSSAKRQCKAPYVAFLDFEAKMENVSNEQNFVKTNCENCKIGGPVRQCSHAERELSNQLPMTYSFFVFSSEGELVYQKTNSLDDNLIADFFSALQDCEKVLQSDNLNKYKKLHWSNRLEEMFIRETKCYLCGNVFVPGDPKYKPVRDHCHITAPIYNPVEKCMESKYLGAAHAECNLQRRVPKHIPVYVHNFMSYDSNFLLKHLGVKDDMQSSMGKVRCMPYNNNKMRTMEIGVWKFLDSYQMLSGSLADLVNNLSLDKEEFPMVQQGLSVSNKNIKLFSKKAAFPYDWVKSVSQLKSTTDFPPYESFYSILKGDNISKEHYEAGKNIFQKLNCKNMLEYTEFYCKLDTLLLAEVMFSFRETIYDSFNLAIENFISLPQLSFEACLKKIDKPIEKMSDPTMVLMFEKNIRGGVSFVNTRHVKVESPDDSILYIDANNLYGWAQKMYLPIGEYSWLDERLIDSLKWEQMRADQEHGYVAEVDLEFPPELHEKLDNLPLAPYHETIVYKRLSSYSKKVQRNLLGSKRAKNYRQNKLLTDLTTKKRYVVHYMNLQFYLKLGAKLKKVHNVIKFKQEDILKPFIEFASEMRAKSKTKFATDLWKMLSNSLYGKFIQDVRKYASVTFVDNQRQLGKLISTNLFKDAHKITDNLCMVFMRNKSLLLDRLYGIGFTILELSKLFMYNMWYDFIQPKFGDNAELVLTDTDSFVIKFKGHTKQQALEKLAPVMDFSNFPKDSTFYSEQHKKVPGYFKDEYPAGIITEAVNVRSKCYFLNIEPDNNITVPNNSPKKHIVCKGISQNISSKFPIELYKECVYSDNTAVYSTMHRIRAKKRRLCTVAVTKQTISSGDDKRHQLCSIHSVPYGSKYAKLSKKSCVKCSME